MAIVRAFKGIRPIKEMASKIAALPYDVVDSNEARIIVEGNDLSFLHIDKAEIDLDESVSIYDDKVYDKAKENLDRMINSGVYIQDEVDSLYIYRQIMNGRIQTGLVCCTAIDDYINNIIKKHELTRCDKEQDRIKHINRCDANTGPIFLAYKEETEICKIINKWVEKQPIYNFVSEDGIAHIVWKIDDLDIIDKIERLFKSVKYLYIADGHHRSASAIKVGLMRRRQNASYFGEEEFNYFMSILYPDTELQVLSYNRVVRDLNGYSEEEFLAEIKKYFIINKIDKEFSLSEKHTFGMYLIDKWYLLRAKENTYDEEDMIGQLDVSILQKNILEGILGIKDIRTSDRIEFIGGIKGIEELQNRVNSGMKVAFLMFPVIVEDIMKIADIGEIMPPKSTWFEPKPRSGLFIHKLN